MATVICELKEFDLQNESLRKKEETESNSPQSTSAPNVIESQEKVRVNAFSLNSEKYILARKVHETAAKSGWGRRQRGTTEVTETARN